MNALLNLPPEVLVKSIFPLLGWNDLLRLRRTCKAAKNLVDDHLRNHPELAPELEINEKEKNIRAFMDLGIATRKMFLNNTSGSQFYESAPQTAALFLAEYAPTVSHLRVAKFPMHCTEKTKLFLDAFTYLEGFEADQIILRRSAKRTVDNGIELFTFAPTDLPANLFEHVRTLKLGPPVEEVKVEIVGTYRELLGKCSSVEKISFSFNSLRGQIQPVRNYPMERLLEFLRFYETTVRLKAGVLKVIDCSGLPAILHGALAICLDERIYDMFNLLCQTCVTHNVLLANVRSEWFNMAEAQHRWTTLGRAALSMTSGYRPYDVIFLEVPNLEKLDIPAIWQTQDYWPSYGEDWIQSPCTLPKLKSLSIPIFCILQGMSMCRWLFHGARLENLTELQVTLNLGVNACNEDAISVLTNTLTVLSCPNLKRLKIEGLFGPQQSLVRLLEIVGTSLEELTLSMNRTWILEDYDLVGADEENPFLLKLTSLKKLTLEGLDSLPDITDTLFLKVIRCMKLTHLKLSSCDPIKSVTLRGIESLLEGTFAESIEKFPFQHWSLEGVSPEEFHELGNKFRCLSV